MGVTTDVEIVLTGVADAVKTAVNTALEDFATSDPDITFDSTNNKLVLAEGVTLDSKKAAIEGITIGTVEGYTSVTLSVNAEGKIEINAESETTTTDVEIVLTGVDDTVKTAVTEALTTFAESDNDITFDSANNKLVLAEGVTLDSKKAAIEGITIGTVEGYTSVTLSVNAEGKIEITAEKIVAEFTFTPATTDNNVLETDIATASYAIHKNGDATNANVTYSKEGDTITLTVTNLSDVDSNATYTLVVTSASDKSKSDTYALTVADNAGVTAITLGNLIAPITFNFTADNTNGTVKDTALETASYVIKKGTAQVATASYSKDNSSGTITLTVTGLTVASDLNGYTLEVTAQGGNTPDVYALTITNDSEIVIKCATAVTKA